jgi:signal transduction histidine kinase
MTADKSHEDELRNVFLRRVSHDVRTPLTAVLSAARLLEDDCGLTEEQRTQFTRMIVRNAQRIRRLLDDVLDIERLTRGEGMEPMRDDVNVRAVIDAVVDELNAGGRTITVECSVERMTADPMQFERVVYNLIGNALKHTEGDVAVRVWPAEGGTMLAVDDSGAGVPDDVKDAIFEPFRRATDVHMPGTGIGLSVVAAFSKAHGGRAWVEDRAGGGSSFLVFFADEAA